MWDQKKIFKNIWQHICMPVLKIQKEGKSTVPLRREKVARVKSLSESIGRGPVNKYISLTLEPRSFTHHNRKKDRA